MTNFVLTVEEFQLWLESLPARKVVSYSDYYSENCPISQFVKTKFNEDVGVSTSANGVITVGSQYQLLPPTLEQFVHDVDKFCDMKHNITAGRALKILNAVGK